LRFAMLSEGLSEKEARARFWVVDKDGLLDSDRRDLTEEQKNYARDRNEIADWARNGQGKIGLPEVISQINATVLIGLSTVHGIFSEPIVREMARKTERPIIFPLSNPTSHSEADPADLIAWTDGRALVATGSPFAPAKYGGRTINIARCCWRRQKLWARTRRLSKIPRLRYCPGCRTCQILLAKSLLPSG
jgi:malate dehydrogenase (oxaloacetate-decarboxylating)